MITNIASILNPLPCYNVPIKFNSHDRYIDLQKGFKCFNICISIELFLNLALASIVPRC